MAEGRSKALWGPTSHVLWLIAEVNRGPKSPRTRPGDWNPHARRAEREEPIERMNVKDAKGLLLGLRPVAKR